MSLGRLLQGKRPWVPYACRGSFQDVIRRWKVTSLVDPPLNCEVIEKPYTVVLLEDPWFYQDSWHEEFAANLGPRFGMSFASLKLPEDASFDDMVAELKVDLPPFPDAVLVARGPIASWSASFYLESFALKGMIMVDPVLLDSSDSSASQVVELLTQRAQNIEPVGMENLLQGARGRSLRLEPGCIPMQVFQSSEAGSEAQEVAARHSDPDGPFGKIQVHPFSQESHAETVMQYVDRWVQGYFMDPED